ncbi:FprA family A-type flavoprotein [Acetonema longum]|uniref:Flavodoxin/nitric oxide synthase n=1 Tax=Acetonema longum DSM 6540 TaxID=1009370 RepID=F7NM69_9FIRM|nr:FprA family A-type flavoprotein [Acetonema longum]EGO62870.1 flavodoxin/nitric oxide synthase [Acetonema longum DSM 6540]
MNRVQLTKGVYYVGAVDWNLRDFHGYATPGGVTYNSYLIVDEKICLIDAVKAPFAGELLARIRDIVDPAKIDYVVVNHIEPDHSGALPAIMEHMPQAKVILTQQGKDGLVKHYQKQYDFQVVKEGDSLALGNQTLRFIPLPMVHWPDSMASYLDKDQILFSNDAFGQHICTTKRFDGENNLPDVLYEAAKYYANILMPFSKLVAKALPKIKELPIKLIAPSHGVVWRDHIPEILAKYELWGSGKTRDTVVIAYDTMWGSTETMARYILEGVAAAGVNGKLYRMSLSDRSSVLKEVLEARGVIVGSSTLNNGMLPNIGALMLYMKGLRPAGKLAAAFGAYGWAGGAQAALEEMMQQAGMQVEPGLAIKWIPDPAEIQRCYQMGYDFAQKVLNSK